MNELGPLLIWTIELLSNTHLIKVGLMNFGLDVTFEKRGT